MPPLPAIRALPSPAWSTIKLYGDESFTNFFRRLTFSPDGGLLLTPAGQFEDPSFPPEPKKTEETPSQKKKSRSSDNVIESTNPNSASSVFIYSRANFARPPIAQLPGHKKASVAVRFSPILYEFRNAVAGAERSGEPEVGKLEKGKEGIDILGKASDVLPPSPRTEKGASVASIAAPSPLPPDASSTMTLLAPLPLNPPTPSPSSKPSTPAVPAAANSGSVFALPYRMLYAVLTMDTVAIYDTQQAGPVCLLTKLHYDEFTDMSWYVKINVLDCSPINHRTGLLMVSVSSCHQGMGIARSSYSTRFFPRITRNNPPFSSSLLHTTILYLLLWRLLPLSQCYLSLPRQ